MSKLRAAAHRGSPACISSCLRKRADPGGTPPWGFTCAPCIFLDSAFSTLSRARNLKWAGPEKLVIPSKPPVLLCCTGQEILLLGSPLRQKAAQGCQFQYRTPHFLALGEHQRKIKTTLWVLGAGLPETIFVHLTLCKFGHCSARRQASSWAKSP